MRAVGIRELKAKLSEYIRLVGSGEPVLVTDRGTVVAELRPPGAAAPADADPLEALVRAGQATPGAPHDPELYGPRRRAVPGASVEELLAAERAEGGGTAG